MTLKAKIAALAAVVLMGAGATSAAKAGDYNGNFMIRLQGTELVTNDSVRRLSTGSGTDLRTLGYDAKVSDEFIPTATVTYFMSKNMAVELFCCFATASVDLKQNGGTLGEVAKGWLFPPALTLQWHFDKIGAFKPYVGAGVQWVHYFDVGTGTNILKSSSVSFNDSFGPVLQAGFDMELGGGWYANFDVKKSFMSADVTWNNVTSPASLGTVYSKVDIDPLTISAGVGYRFNLSDIFGSRSSVPLK